MVYLTGMAYVILVYILYLLKSIDLFNLIENGYIQLVKAGLIVFMANTREMVYKSSIYLYELMNKLIKQFCVVIKGIFLLIEAKLLFYLKQIELEIKSESFKLSVDLASILSHLIDLKSLITRYQLILDDVTKIFRKHKKIITPILGKFSFIFFGLYKIVKSLMVQFKSICSSYDKLNGISCCLQQSTGSGPGINFPNNIIVTINNTLSSITHSIVNIDHSTIAKFQKGVESIKNILDETDPDVWKEINPIIQELNVLEIITKSNVVVTVSPFRSDLKIIGHFQRSVESIQNLLKMIKTKDIFDMLVSPEVISILGKLYIIEQINPIKLFLLITQIQNLYLNVLLRGYLLLCEILFYKEITTETSKLFKLMNFECCNVRDFLSKCSKVEKYISTMSIIIDQCITKLAKVSNKCNIKRISELKEDLLKLVGVISVLKFYVDLMMLEILIFKMIIMNLIVMAVSSVYIDKLIMLISENITSIDKAIGTLIFVHGYLRGFYIIQLQNTLSIFGLSNALNFSQSIHQYYSVLVTNLYLMNRLIWAIECYINHLLLFKFTSVCLNSLTKYIGGLLQIITDLSSVGKSMGAISDKLLSIDKSIAELNNIQEDMDITKWKEKGQSITAETQSISTDVGEINSEISDINKNLESISKSWAALVYVYYFLLGLISYVYLEIEKTSKRNEMVLGIGNQFYKGVIVSVMEPTNKELKFILGYLIVMSVVMRNLIKFVETSIGLIIAKMGWLYGLTKVLQDDIDKINKGVVDMECAIEGVARNLIKYTLLSLSTDIQVDNNKLFNINRSNGY